MRSPSKRSTCGTLAPANQLLQQTGAAARSFEVSSTRSGRACWALSFGETPGGRGAEVQGPWPGESDRSLPWEAAGS